MASTASAERPLRTVAGIGTNHAEQTNELLQQRLVSLIDLELTLKHVHWNVVGPNFIAVHEMLDTFVDEVRPMIDDLAERIRTLGGVPTGLLGALVKQRSWDDYSLLEADTEQHLRALDTAYDGIGLDHRRAMVHAANTDPVSEDLLIGQTATLEQQQWFIRSFLRGHQPDADARRFGSADREPTAQEMAETGASVSGESQISS